MYQRYLFGGKSPDTIDGCAVKSTKSAEVASVALLPNVPTPPTISIPYLAPPAQ